MRFTRSDGSTFELPDADARLVYREMRENYLADEIIENYYELVGCEEAPDVPEEELQPSSVRASCRESMGDIMDYMFGYDSFCETWSEVLWWATRELANIMKRKYPPKPPKIPLPHRNARI
jgi:hypothetical protein